MSHQYIYTDVCHVTICNINLCINVGRVRPRERTRTCVAAHGGGGSLHQCVPRVDQKQNQTKTKRLWDRYGMRTTVYIARRKVGTSVGIACKQRVRAVAVDPTVMEGSAVPLHLHRHVPSCLWPWINDENVWLRASFVCLRASQFGIESIESNKQTNSHIYVSAYILHPRIRFSNR